MWRRRGPDAHPRRRRRRGGQGGGGTGGGDVVRRRGHRAREVTGSPTEEHFLGSVRRGIGTGGEVAGSGGGGEGRRIIPHPDGGGGEVGGSAGCRGRRRRRGPAAAAGCQGSVVGCRAATARSHDQVPPAAAHPARSRWARRTLLQNRTKNGRRCPPFVRALAARVFRAQSCSEGM